MKYIFAFAVATMLSTAMGFAPVHHQAPRMTSMQASFDPMNLSENKIADHVHKFATAAAATLMMSPLAALAGEFHVYFLDTKKKSRYLGSFFLLTCLSNICFVDENRGSR